jgi:hypothetical protein
MKRDSIFILATRGLASALETWKALLLLLVLNAMLAAAFTHPLTSALRQTLDRSPWAERLVAKNGDLHTFFAAFARTRPDVLGDLSKWNEVATGERGERGALGRSVPLSGFFRTTGISGSAVGFAALAALLAALFSGGFAGRFGAERERMSLVAFAADAVRLAFPSILFGALSLAGIVSAYRWIYAASGTLYEPDELRYEWEAVGLLLLRFAVFLLVAGVLRLVVLYARAALGLGTTNPFAALARGLGFVLGRPVRTLALEILFGTLGVLPLLAWLLFGPVWDGRRLADFALILLGQELVVLLRILMRAGHLGAASAYLKRSKETGVPASARTTPAMPYIRVPEPPAKPAPVPTPAP